MKNICIASMISIFCFCTLSFAEVNVTGDVEIDTDYISNSEESVTDGVKTTTDTSQFNQGGRAKLGFASKKTADTSDFFAAAAGQIEMSIDDDDYIADAYVQFGTTAFNVKLGRFEAEGLFDQGEDVLLVSTTNAPYDYEACEARGRYDSAGQVLFSYTATENFNAELGTVYGNDSIDYESDTETGETTTTSVDMNVLGVRPVVKFSSDIFMVKAGVDYLMKTTQDDGNAEETQIGYGGTAEVSFAPFTIGAAAAMGTKSGKTPENVDDKDADYLKAGGYTKISLGEDMIGTGVFYLSEEIEDATDADTQIQAYVAYIHSLPVEGLKVKFAGAYSTSDLKSNSDVSEDAFGVRVRFNYDF